MIENVHMKRNITFITTLLVILLVSTFTLTSCKKGNSQPASAEPETPTQAETKRTVYIPKDFATMDFSSGASTWSYSRSQQSEHFVIFWGAGYGNKNPNAADVPELYRVDVDDLLKKAESFYEMNISKLKFAEAGVGRSNLDKYKMIIFLSYTTSYIANGGGLDDVIGVLWLSPNPVRPVGSVLAHEIGHCFQYQVYCDLKGTTGFRYGYGGNNGNSYWEQTAQWQAQQNYPIEVFTSGQFGTYTYSYNRHILHESQRYSNYFTNHYWASKHGVEIIKRIWREAKQPEDPIQTYMRLTKIDFEQFNNEVYDAAKKFVTWDLDGLRVNGANYIGQHGYAFTALAGGVYRVSYNLCPQTTGYNVIPLTLPGAGTTVTIDFKGVANATGFNVVNAGRAGWRYGYVALLTDGTRVYSDRSQGTEKQVSFTIPANCSKLWFVVTGAPTTYAQQPWDDNAGNDDQWPYELKLTNTKIIGY